MKVELLARPDHSVFLYGQLRDAGVDVTYYTFHAFRKGGLWNRLWPSRKTVPASAHAATLFTLLDYPLARLGQRLRLNTRPLESRLAEHLLRPPGLAEADLIHYWPFQFGPLVQQLRARRHVATLADYFEAEPSFANALFEHAYARAGLPFGRQFNELIDQNAAFAFEHDFVVPSELTAESYRRKFPEARIHVVPYGLMGKAMADRVTAPPRRRWVFVGRVCLEKGIDVLLDAMNELPDHSVDLIGGVAPEQERYLRDRVARASNVRLVGHLPNTEVLARLPSYDAFVMPSLCDSYSIATIEAACAGLPVVVTDHCGVESAVRTYQLGAVCAAGDAGALAAALQQVEQLDEARLVAGRERFARAETELSYGQRMLALYRSLLSA